MTVSNKVSLTHTHTHTQTHTLHIYVSSSVTYVPPSPPSSNLDSRVFLIFRYTLSLFPLCYQGNKAASLWSCPFKLGSRYRMVFVEIFLHSWLNKDLLLSLPHSSVVSSFLKPPCHLITKADLSISAKLWPFTLLIHTHSVSFTAFLFSSNNSSHFHSTSLSHCLPLTLMQGDLLIIVNKLRCSFAKTTYPSA